MDFYTITTISAILLLIISLTTIGVVISNSISSEEFPKFHNPCPDYWTYSSSPELGDFCNSNGINSPVGVPTAFRINNTKELNNTRLQNNCNYAKSNLLQWDGVSNYNKCIPISGTTLAPMSGKSISTGTNIATPTPTVTRR